MNSTERWTICRQNMGNILESLKKHVFRRRERKHTYSRFQRYHEERLPIKKLTSVNHNTQELDPLVVSTTTIQATDLPNGYTDFYLACRDNDYKKVRELLRTMTLDEVDRLDSNGSTALHAACYYGNAKIVKLLLKKGADRAIQNKYECLPYDEAANDEIKELFLRVPNSNRLVSDTGAIEWILIDDDVMETAKEERYIIKSLYDNSTGTTPIDKMFEKIEKNYINKGLTNVGGMKQIRRYFRKATEQQNTLWIIKAYTAETDFYRILNNEIAAGASQYQNERRYIIALISHDIRLNELTFIGTAYRVVRINNDELKKYEVDCSLMTKSFVSSSIDRKVAELFLCQREATQSETQVMTRKKIDGTLIKTWIMCRYEIKHRRTGLHIENPSQYANEGEVLIMPYSVFQVKEIRKVQLPFFEDDQFMTEIDLEECDQYL
ncbi:unnamed protein product [Rotaria sp. Silwood1]|nr:unnamed protein product [Rotaria sp. Silwood1]CAF1254474.1 unnamed protein product [Rotaria sp. Silwood1]CAF3365158.1 unnamed protein product [Rotaria sp. Silwood1]CAF3499796.1 unnamed protein product [Rotaria sp. Silwood1]CAF3505807.1 unnamed protein product [Rotaria sp. Silwood1]